ncbi:MAG: BolA family protein [Gallionella sp.]
MNTQETNTDKDGRIARMTALLDVLKPLSVDIIDDSHLHAGHVGARDGGGHYRLNIVSAEFAGKTTIAKHRMIYSVLAEMMKHDIHALNISAHVPE